MSPLFLTILKQVADCESYLRMAFVCLIYLVSQFTSYLFLSPFNAAGDHLKKLVLSQVAQAGNMSIGIVA